MVVQVKSMPSPVQATALDATLKVDKIRTGDLGGSATTDTFAKAVIARLGS